MTVDTVLIVVGALVLGPGLVSTAIKRVWLSVPLVALILGVLLGPELLAVIEPSALGSETHILEQVARITLAMSLVATGLQITADDLRVNRLRATMVLTVVMGAMWLLTALGAYILLDVPLWIGVLIGAILTPTDPVVASSLVTGRLAEANLPRWLRRSLQIESGANDGLALLFVLLPLIVLTHDDDELSVFAGEVATQLAIAVGVGVAIGVVFGKLVNAAEEHEPLEKSFFLPVSVGLALVALGTTHALGGTGVLASFIAGLSFSLVVRERYQDELETVQSGVERLVIVPVFALFGAMLPWHEWSTLGLSGLAFAVWVLLLRRPPAVPPALLPTDTPRRGVAFLSWFGPLGVAAIYYATFAERYDLEHYETVFAATTLAIAASVLVHTVSATPLVRLYGGRSATGTIRHPFRPGVEEED